MQILARCKDINGEVIAYKINNDGNIFYMSSGDALANKHLITNAYVVNGKYFRALKGHNIETICDLSNLSNIIKPVSFKNKIDNSNIYETDYYGKEFINICKKIRRYAISGKLTVDKSTHKSNRGNNIHLFKLIESCGITVDSFVKGYLSTIHPYYLEKFSQGNSLTNHDIWVCDIGYKTKLLIKINDYDTNKPIVVSFHESNKHDSYKTGKHNFSDKPYAVIADNVVQSNSGNYIVKYTVQRGFLRHSGIRSVTKYFKNDIALVKYSDIKETFDDEVNNIIDKLSQIYIERNLEAKDSLYVTKLDSTELSFMSLGVTPTNNLSLLIDMHSGSGNHKIRTLASNLAEHITSELTETKSLELREALQLKYGINYTNELYLMLVDNLLK